MNEFTLPPLDVQSQHLDRTQQPRPWQLLVFGLLALSGLMASWAASLPEQGAVVARQDALAPR